MYELLLLMFLVLSHWQSSRVIGQAGLKTQIGTNSFPATGQAQHRAEGLSLFNLVFKRKSSVIIILLSCLPQRCESRDSISGTSIDYGLDDRGVGVRVPVESRIVSSPRLADRLWGPPSLLSNGYRCLFPRG
jgi:hypothetical protein